MSDASSPAPGHRSVAEELERQAALFATDSLAGHLLDAVPSILLILNRHRQVVFANRSLFELVGSEGDARLQGLRPGEALHCINAGSSPAGCGTAEHCRACGMLEAILAGFSSGSEERDCRITLARNGQAEALDLRVRTVPLDYGPERFLVFSIADISDQKRRQALERIFFHDILNLAGGIRGVAEILQEVDSDDRAVLAARIHQAAEQIVDEIQAQRTLSAAESQDLRPRPEAVGARDLLNQVSALYRAHDVARDRQLRVDPAAEDVSLVSDPRLLHRVLGNLVKNALEASAPGQTVTIGYRQRGGSVEFRVHNAGHIPEDIRLRIFQRSFSTRGPGRGLGTYSIRLLSEEYLGGSVSFHSTPQEGTTFLVRVPRSWSGDR